MPLSRMPSLSSLRAFEAAARRLSFKDAADELSVTPGAISQQVRSLEDDLGISLFHRATRSVSLTEAERAAQLAEVSAALGLDLTSVPDAEGLTLKRAQVLGFNGKPLVQLAYQRADGTPVALCIIPAGPDGKAVSMGVAQGMELARWNTPGFGFLLIGGQDQQPLRNEADAFQSGSVGDAI